MSSQLHETSEFLRKPRPSGKGPVALIILDGFGLRENTYGNAVEQAHKPIFDALWERFPHTTLRASEEAVGLPKGQFGNSEVGHSNLGAGRVLYQDLTRINRAIENGEFEQNPVLVEAMQYAKTNDKALHFCGLVSDGGVHSHLRHLQALIRMAAKFGLKKVFIHAFMDGRDTAPTQGVVYLEQVIDTMNEVGVGQIATLSGRYYAMDRDKRWERTGKAYRAMTDGQGERADNPLNALKASYEKGVTDEFVLPTVIVDKAGQPIRQVENGDAIIFFNFRPDRAIQISQAFTGEDFTGFDRGANSPKVHFVCMTRYSETVHGAIAFDANNLANTFGEVVSNAGLTQLRAAETEKFPHVTFFFSGGREAPFPGEQRILIPSPKVATYDLKPEMSAFELAKAVSDKVRTGEIDALILNFANPDMVGHTGSLPAAIKAIEAVDKCLGQVLDALAEQDGVALVTADHGNADRMVDPETGGPCTTHTLSIVPLIITKQGVTLEHGVLADLAPTLLALLGVNQPAEMTGKSLIRETV